MADWDQEHPVLFLLLEVSIVVLLFAALMFFHWEFLR